MKPKKFCNHSSCRKIVNYNQKFCEKHEEEQKRSYKSDSHSYKREKYGKYHAFYKTRRWRRASQLHRVKHPLCVMCLEQGIIKEADVTDHIIELRDDWSKRYDESNFQSLCHSCHLIKTEKERERRNQA